MSNNIPDNIDELDAALLEKYRGRCVNCISALAVCIHEIVPRSQRPDDWWEDDNRVPLCDACHRQVHATGTRANTDALRGARVRMLKILDSS